VASHQRFAEVVPAEHETFGPGQTVRDPLAGDFILTHGDAWTSKLIRFGQRLRCHGTDAKYARWNHAAMFVDEDGNLIEALGGGVQKRNVSVYQGTEYTIVRIQKIIGGTGDREEVMKFAEWSLGQPYGFMAIVSIAIGLIFGGSFTFGFDGQSICSGLVARALERTSAIFNREPSRIMPADLAKYFRVEPPSASMPRGTVPPRRSLVVSP
jgi:uncharacterized protein YycO